MPGGINLHAVGNKILVSVIEFEESPLKGSLLMPDSCKKAPVFKIGHVESVGLDIMEMCEIQIGDYVYFPDYLSYEVVDGDDNLYCILDRGEVLATCDKVNGEWKAKKPQ